MTLNSFNTCEKCFLKILLFLFLCIPVFGFAQSAPILVKSITIEGNKRTKEAIVLREMDFGVGDTIPFNDLGPRLEKNKLLILNSGLFTIVKMNVKDWSGDNHIGIQIEVQEQWYLYPYPIFELADRNFNVWWQEQNRALNRINLGLRVSHLNLTGRSDQLKITTQFGYTQKYEVDYTLPYFNKKQNLGFNVNAFFSGNREVNYQTQQNKFVFYRGDEFQRKTTRFRAGLLYRPGIYFYNRFDIEFHQNISTDTVATILNPDYFLNGKTDQRFFALQYSFAIDYRNIRPYPTAGYFWQTTLRKEGVGLFGDLNNLKLSTTYAQYVPLRKKWNLELILKGRVFLQRQQQPYYNSRALGFQPDFLRGHELYVVDGMDFGIGQTSIRYELFNKNISLERFMPLKQLKVMPLKIYLALNNDVGIVNDPHYATGNSFSNKVLWGGGIGIDIVAYYDKVIQIQYSFNQLWENGLFLHHKFTF